MSEPSSPTKPGGKPVKVPVAEITYKVKTRRGATSLMVHTQWNQPGSIHLTTGLPGGKFPQNITEKRRRQLDKGCQLAYDAIVDAAETFKHF